MAQVAVVSRKAVRFGGTRPRQENLFGIKQGSEDADPTTWLRGPGVLAQPRSGRTPRAAPRLRWNAGALPRRAPPGSPLPRRARDPERHAEVAAHAPGRDQRTLDRRSDAASGPRPA